MPPCVRNGSTPDWWTTSPKADAEAGRRRAQIAADEATNYPRNRKKEPLMASTTTLIGNTTGDIEIRFSQSGKPVGSLTIAVSDRKYDRDRNEWVDAGTWFARCTIFGDLAERVADSIPKGTRVIAFGRIVQNDWTDREGQKRTSVEVIVDELGPSVRYATAVVTKAGGSGGRPQQQPQQPAQRDPWANQPSSRNTSEEPPF